MKALRAKQVVIFALITTVVLQIIYMAALGGPQPAQPGQPTTGADVIRYFDERGVEVTIVWLIEAIAFLAIAICGFLLLARSGLSATASTALALSGVFNTVQIGIGLSMFEPIARVGGDDPSLFYAFVSGAFFYYFSAKALIGIAGITLGLQAARQSGGLSKTFGWLAVVSGLAAVVSGIVAMGVGFPALFAAGAAGTVATLFTALALSRLPLND